MIRGTAVDYSDDSRFAAFPAAQRRGAPPAPDPNYVRIRYSNFFFTFNTNWRPASQEEVIAEAHAHRAACMDVFSNNFDGNRLLRWVQDRAGAIVDPTGTVADVKKIITGFQLELGDHPKGRRFHVHGIIRIAHTKMLKLNYDALVQYYNEALARAGGTHPIVYKNIRAQRVTAEQYMNKFYDVARDRLVASARNGL
jgi:hypothetical protein